MNANRVKKARQNKKIEISFEFNSGGKGAGLSARHDRFRSHRAFAAAYASDDILLAAKLLETAPLAPEQKLRIDRLAPRA